MAPAGGPSSTGGPQRKSRVPTLKGSTIVYRHMRDGDLMLTNRQPTLHKPGLMAHSARIFHTVCCSCVWGGYGRGTLRMECHILHLHTPTCSHTPTCTHAPHHHDNAMHYPSPLVTPPPTHPHHRMKKQFAYIMPTAQRSMPISMVMRSTSTSPKIN